MKQILGIILFVLCFTGNVFASSIEDFACHDIKIGDNYQMVIEKIGQSKTDIEKVVDGRIVVYYIYKDLRVGIDQVSNQVVDIRLSDKDYIARNGVKIGATPHKILKEYGKAVRERQNGRIYYIYHKEDQKLMFDISAGYLEEIRLTNLDH